MEFTREQRSIFKYFNGIEDVFGDPLEIFDTMTHLLGCHPNQAIARIGGVEEVKDATGKATYEVNGELGLPALEALRRFCEAINQAFELVPFDKKTGLGATRQIQFAAWQALHDFNQKKNPNTGLWPTS